MATGAIAGAFIGAMASAAVHGFRGGSGNGAFLAMLGGAAAGFAGGYGSAFLGPMMGLGAGSGAALTGEAAAYGGLAGGMGFGAGGAAGALGGATLGGLMAGSMTSLISGFGKVAMGAFAEDYPQNPSDPNFSTASGGMRRRDPAAMNANLRTGTQKWTDGTRWTQADYDKYFQNMLFKYSMTGNALSRVKQGTGEGGMITLGDVMTSLDPGEQSPLEGKMTKDRWDAISGVYMENRMGQFAQGSGNWSTDLALSKAKEGFEEGSMEANDKSYRGIPLVFNPEDSKWYLPEPSRNTIDKQEVIQGYVDPAVAYMNEQNEQNDMGNSSILDPEKSPDSDYYYTAPQTPIDNTPESTDSQMNYARGQARQRSFAAARASEESNRSQSLMKTQKSLSLPRFDEEYGSASKRFTQKPKPF